MRFPKYIFSFRLIKHTCFCSSDFWPGTKVGKVIPKCNFGHCSIHTYNVYTFSINKAENAGEHTLFSLDYWEKFSKYCDIFIGFWNNNMLCIIIFFEAVYSSTLKFYKWDSFRFFTYLIGIGNTNEYKNWLTGRRFSKVLLKWLCIVLSECTAMLFLVLSSWFACVQLGKGRLSAGMEITDCLAPSRYRLCVFLKSVH